MEDLNARTAREVLDDHLDIANRWTAEPFEAVLEEDLRRNVAEDVVVLINRGVFRGHEGVRKAWTPPPSGGGKIVAQTIHHTVEAT